MPTVPLLRLSFLLGACPNGLPMRHIGEGWFMHRFLTIVGVYFLVSLCDPAHRVQAQSTLRSEAARIGFCMGNAAWEAGTRGHESCYTNTLKREFNSVSTRAQLCMAVCHPSETSYNFGEADAVFDFAEQNKMKVWAHCLLSTQDNPATLPGWIKGKSRDQLLAIVRDHLHTVINRYKNRGIVIAWSVVNEPCKSGFFQSAIGPDWIEKVLQYAYEADPNTPLLLNEYGVERGPAGDKPKWERFYGMVKGLKERGVPIHAVGFQGYFELDTNMNDVANAMRRFQDIGIKVHLTEVAVRVHARNPSLDTLQAQGKKLREILRTCLDAPNCEVMTIFGITDKLHWLVLAGHTDAPVIFDGNFNPKPAYDAVMAELQSHGPKVRWTPAR